ncbi:DUF58 domain-containing protein [Planctomicrobium sp.]|jgi:uncharacterized protein (DUF58 family)|nr:DUF58 domain-containing protein [Planctomicrobium sp.]MDA7503584.1 DUF58 domain-containing protein [bacterium]MDB4743282.1 DUF58 domain-containing protein [Planctomicrobium sp.]
MANDPPLHDPSALAKFANLDVVAKLIVEGYMIGQHKSPFKGSSVEFVEHRQYYPGDEIRHIDWRAYGKTGKYYIKEYEEETNLRAYILLDCSGSMGYSESSLAKIDYARQLAAAFAYLLNAQRDAIGLMTFDNKVRERMNPATSPKNFQQVMKTLDDAKPGGETGLGKLFASIAPTLKRRSLIIILSDFFDDIKVMQQAMQLFRRHRHEVMLFQIIAPEEEDFPFSKPTQFRSLELEKQRILVDPHRLRSIYLTQFAEFQKNLIELTGRIGFDLQTIKTSEPYEKALGSYLDSRTRGSAR